MVSAYLASADVTIEKGQFTIRGKSAFHGAKVCWFWLENAKSEANCSVP